MPRTRSPGSTTLSRARCGGAWRPRAAAANNPAKLYGERGARHEAGPSFGPPPAQGEIMPSWPLARLETPKSRAGPVAGQLARAVLGDAGGTDRRPLGQTERTPALRAGPREPGPAYRAGRWPARRSSRASARRQRPTPCLRRCRWRGRPFRPWAKMRSGCYRPTGAASGPASAWRSTSRPTNGSCAQGSAVPPGLETRRSPRIGPGRGGRPIRRRALRRLGAPAKRGPRIAPPGGTPSSGQGPRQGLRAFGAS